MVQRWRVGGWIAAALGAGALGGAVWWVSRPTRAASEDGGGFHFVLPVTLTRLERGVLRPATEITGDVRAARRARLAFESEGVVAELRVAEADAVSAGEVLARLVDEDRRLELASAEAELERVRRKLERLEAGEREEDRRRLKALFEASAAEADLARLEVERARALRAEDVVPQSEVDTRAAALRAAEERRDAARAAWEAAVHGTRPEDLAVARAEVEAARTRVDAARRELEKTVLRAPWAGAIVERFVSEGDWVAKGAPVFELVDLAALEVHLDVPGRLGDRLGPGTAVRLPLPGAPGDALETSIDATVPAADETAKSFRAIARLSGEEARALGLKPGLFCRATLLLEPFEDVWILPSDAVLASEHGRHIVRAREGPPAEPGGPPGLVAEIVPVEVLGQAGTRSAIRSLGPPLEEGEAICLVGADNAFPGAPLLPRGESAGDAAPSEPGASR